MKNIKIFILAILMLGVAFAGDEARLGTTAGTQVSVPVGARDLAMAGADLVYTRGVDAVFWNPASIGGIQGATGTFSNMSYIADVNVNYFAVGTTMGQLGNIAVTAKSIDMGDIPITTVESMDGTGASFSPTIMTMALTYGKAFTDRINFGITGKMIYESIPRASASTVAFDIGVQYVDFANINGLGLALVLKNIGGDLHYSGSGLKTEATSEVYSEFFDREASYDQLPSSYSIASSYKIGESIVLGASFVSNNTSYDEVNIGGEYNFNNMIYLRGGLNSAMVQDVDKDNVLFGPSFGFGIHYELLGVGLLLDYAYRPANYFSGNQLISLGFAF